MAKKTVWMKIVLYFLFTFFSSFIKYIFIKEVSSIKQQPTDPYKQQLLCDDWLDHLTVTNIANSQNVFQRLTLVGFTVFQLLSQHRCTVCVYV